MRCTSARYRHALRLTFFTRSNCMLCTEAKDVLSKVWDRKPFEYDEIDVMETGKKQWKDLYEFDTPVVHVDRKPGFKPIGETTAKARKLMHRFTEAEVEFAMKDVEREDQ